MNFECNFALDAVLGLLRRNAKVAAPADVRHSPLRAGESALSRGRRLLAVGAVGGEP